MPIIDIKTPLPPEGHDPNHCNDFLGLIFEADGTALDKALDRYPDLPRFFGHYGVPMDEAVHALDQRRRTQDVVYWERVVGGPVLWIPHHCAQVLS